MDDDTWHVVRSTPRVTGFVGSGQTPSPLTRGGSREHSAPRHHFGRTSPSRSWSFERNEQVRIVDGPFANFTGVVEEVNADRSTLKISVTIFGRSTPVELDFAQVEKIASVAAAIKVSMGTAATVREQSNGKENPSGGEAAIAGGQSHSGAARWARRLARRASTSWISASSSTPRRPKSRTE